MGILCEIYVSHDCHNNKTFIYPNNISKLFTVMETQRVLCEAETEFILLRQPSGFKASKNEL